MTVDRQGGAMRPQSQGELNGDYSNPTSLAFATAC